MKMIHVQDIDATKRELIHQLLFQYCHVVDDGELSKWPDFFSDNGSYYVYSKENYDRGLPVAIIMDNHKGKIIDRVTLIKQIWTYNISYQRHMIANIRIEKSNGEKYHCHTNFSIYKTSREGKSELFAVGRDLNAQTGSLSPLVAAGLFYLALTIPLTHLVNYIDNRLRTGRADTSGTLDPLEQAIVVERG